MSSHSVEAEYMDLASKRAWPILYQEIGRVCQSYQYTCLEAKKPQNIHLNRYRDVSPYDHSRVILKRSGNDYINANFVQIRRAKRKYILTQGPLESTVGHFWLMIWEQNSQAIVMLNKLVEKNEIKCHWYWPHGIGSDYTMVLTDVKLSVEQTFEENFSYYTIRVFRVNDMETGESREIFQFHYTTWPDFGVPSSPVAFLNFLEKIRSLGALKSEVGPAVVHCSAGIGRSGTFCLVDSSLVIMEKEGVSSINVPQILLSMRKERMGLIQTPDQLRFSYQAIIEGCKKFHPDYKQERIMDESIYSTVAGDMEEEAPPPPPPRGESLTKAPARPLPAIPTSASLGNLNLAKEFTNTDDCSTNPSGCNSLTPSCFTCDEDESSTSSVVNQSVSSLRRRRTRLVAKRVSAMKERVRETERIRAVKKSLYKHLITFGFILAGIVVYTLVKY